MAANDRRDAAAPTHSIERVIDLTGVEAGVVSDVRVERSWTVHLAGAQRRSHQEPVRHRRRPGPAAGVAVIALVLVAVFAALAVVNHRRGAAWREVALEQAERGAVLEQRLEDAETVVTEAEAAVSTTAAERDAVRAALEAVNGRLGTSEQDVAALEQRLAAVAGDKARLEDELALAGQGRGDASEADELLVRCVQNVGEWLDRAPTQDGDEAWRRWADEAATWGGICDQAIAAVR